MQNKLPIGQTAEADQVDGAAGNDKLNRNSLAAIGNENKRPRYSIFAIAANGPNFYSPAGVWDLVSGAAKSHTLTSVNSEPFDFSSYISVSFTVKLGVSTEAINFVKADDFVDPENATVDELVTKINTLSLAVTASAATGVDAGKITIAANDGSTAVSTINDTSNSILGFPLALEPTEPNRTDPGGSGSSFANGAGNSIHVEYEAREPIVFIGGQVFIGEITPQSTGSALTGSTTVHIEKVDASDSTKVLSLDTHTHAHGPDKYGPKFDNKNILFSVPGSRSLFSNGERFRFRVVPDASNYNATTHGLRGVSAVLWFKALHR